MHILFRNGLERFLFLFIYLFCGLIKENIRNSDLIEANVRIIIHCEVGGVCKEEAVSFSWWDGEKVTESFSHETLCPE
jgi:hypothetical protein